MSQSVYSSLSKEKCNPKVSGFRRVLPQVIATTVKNFLIFDLGLILALPTIIIPALTGIPNEHNRNETLSITATEASWVGSIGYLFQPLGSILSVFITDPLGRKLSMILVNIPVLIGWFVTYKATSFHMILAGCSLLGLGVGLMEGPLITYLGEICEPSVRGVLIAYSNISFSIGLFVGLFLNTLLPWRSVCFVCSFVPVATAIAICFIPETPQWLLSKNRTASAEKSLQWLRGWVPSTHIADEFKRLQRHSEYSKSCNSCIKQQIKCNHPMPTLSKKFAELKRKRTMKPFIIVMVLFTIAQFSGIYSMRPFIVQIYKAYDTPIPADRITAVMSFLENFANLLFMCVVRFTGKRRIYLVMIFGMFVSASVLSGYGFIYLPSGYNSFNQLQDSYHTGSEYLPYIPVISLLSWSFFSSFGCMALPWMLLSEVFPFKSRGIASGVAAAANYLLGFICRKTYYNLETTLSLPGTAMFFSCICGFGFLIMFFILPETENRTLEDIELHFSDNSKKLTNHNIAKSKPNSRETKHYSFEMDDK